MSIIPFAQRTAGPPPLRDLTRHRHRRPRQAQGLVALAARSNWKFSAALAAAGLFAGLVLVPALFSASPFGRGLQSIFTPLALVLAAVFALIALIRFATQASATAAPPALRQEPGAARTPAPTPEPPINTHFSTAQLTSAATHSAARPEAWSLDVLERMEWKRFEDLCCAFYREKGIRAETTPLGPDGGIDIRLYQDDIAPARVTAIVQCKAWNQQVGVKPVRELLGVMTHEKVDKAFFMAPKGFTDDARSFAATNRIVLLDGKLILAMLQRLPTDAAQRLLTLATAGDWTTPTCPDCGARMTARKGKDKGKPFWGCREFPKCRGRLQMRTEVAAELFG